MTSGSGTVGTAGDSYTKYNYPGTYQSQVSHLPRALNRANIVQDFHYCGLEPNNQIVNYDNAKEVWTCELDSLAECVISPHASRCELRKILQPGHGYRARA
jgi:hypothetical protein